MQGFCDICESDNEKKIVDVVGGKDICCDCEKKYLKKQVTSCPVCKNENQKKLKIYSTQIYCGVCKNMYHMTDVLTDKGIDVALSHLHCLN